jgi:hypothetical protein
MSLSKALVALLSCLGLLTACTGGGARPGNRVQGPPQEGATITASNGRPLECPLGSEPVVNITGATFSPKLTGGTHFHRGRYRISLIGVIANETTSAVLVRGVAPWIESDPWADATVSAPDRLAANSSGKLVIVGSYQASGSMPARMGAALNWVWAEPRLRPCHDRGLIEDD